jgi:hypothetical protein
MKRMTGVRLCASLLIIGCVLVPISVQAQDLGNKQALLGQARGAYYNLRSQGMASFQCDVKPNWELLLKDLHQQNPEGATNAINTLNQLHFTTSLATDDSVKVTHNDLAGQSPEMMSALKQIYGGMEQMASGFFDTWKLFMLAAPFPEVSSQYRLESVGAQYKLSYKEGTADIVTTMGHDFAISNMTVITPEFNSAIQPTFTRTPKGLRLASYEATYQSQKPEEATHLKVSVDYQDVEGLSMLQKLSLSGSYGGSPFAIELAFTGCQVTRK